MSRPSRRRAALLVGVVALSALLLFAAARALAARYHDDSLWANALASMGGTQMPGDFGYVFLPAANNVLDGAPLYMDPDAFTGAPQAPYAYPPALAIVLTPIALLPERVGDAFVPGVIWSALLVGAMVGALLLLGVRDWRCYPVAVAYPVTLEAIEYGAVGPILLLLVALGWRMRDRTASGTAIGAGVVVKLFLWPLIVWLALTRRLRAAVTAVVVTAGAVLASWALVGFTGVADYPRLLRKLVQLEAESSYSVLAMLRALGLSEPVSRMLTVALGAALLLAAHRAARSSVSEPVERDRKSLTLVLAAALVLTPILWLHYLVLLVVPIALARPRLSLLWFVPLTLTVFEALGWYRGWPNGDGRALLSAALVAGLVLVASLSDRGDRGVLTRL